MNLFIRQQVLATYYLFEVSFGGDLNGMMEQPVNVPTGLLEAGSKIVDCVQWPR
jgi:hypothetical protein